LSFLFAPSIIESHYCIETKKKKEKLKKPFYGVRRLGGRKRRCEIRRVSLEVIVVVLNPLHFSRVVVVVVAVVVQDVVAM